MAVASDQFTNNGVAVLQLSGTQVNMLQTAGLPTTSIVGIYSANGREWYVCGDGLYKTRALGLPWQRVTMTSLELAQLRQIRHLICPHDNETEFLSYRLAA